MNDADFVVVASSSSLGRRYRENVAILDVAESMKTIAVFGPRTSSVSIAATDGSAEPRLDAHGA